MPVHNQRNKILVTRCSFKQAEKGAKAMPMLAVYLFEFFLLVAVTANVGVECSASSTDQTTCQGDLHDQTCREQVRLYDGVPGVTSRFTSLLEGDDSVVFDKVSRFDDDAINSQDMISKNYLHISANGSDEGWYVQVPRADCLWEATQLVARQIVASNKQVAKESTKNVDKRGPHRLVDEEGKNYPEHSLSPRLHLLLPRESFVHEAVKEGFVRVMSDGTKLVTLSMSPRVFLVDPILSVAECNELIEASSTRFARSGETHYSPGFENYRTSLSGHTPRNSKIAQKLWHRIQVLSALPPTSVEFPQLLKYEERTSWYKKHMDYFHTYDDKPLEDLRFFVKTRAEQLVSLDEDAMEISHVLDENSYDRFDDIQHSLDASKGAILAKALGLHQQVDAPMDLLRRIHYRLRQSKYPIQDFDTAAINLGAQLLEANGVQSADAQALAEKYFGFDLPNNMDLQIEDYVPFFVKPVEFNRHVTILPILGTAEVGGHTAFPHSTSTLGVAPADGELIDECKRGLIVKPETGQALMFYNRLPDGSKDEKSAHAGCPPYRGVKYAANCFTWDADPALAWRFQMRAEEWYQ